MKTILIADEDNGVKNLARLIFSENLGYRVITVSDGADAVLLAREIAPDIVFVDLSLSNQNGYRVSREIKSDPALENTAVLLLSSTSEPLDKKEITGNYGDDALMKPFKPEHLMDKVKALLSQYEKQGTRPLSFTGNGEVSEGSGSNSFREKTADREKPVYLNLFQFVLLSLGRNIKRFRNALQFRSEKLRASGERLKTRNIVSGFLSLLSRFTDILRNYRESFNRYIASLRTGKENPRERRTAFYIQVKGKPLKIETTVETTPVRTAQGNFDKRHYFTTAAGLGAILLITAFIAFAGIKDEKNVFSFIGFSAESLNTNKPATAKNEKQSGGLQPETAEKGWVKERHKTIEDVKAHKIINEIKNEIRRKGASGQGRVFDLNGNKLSEDRSISVNGDDPRRGLEVPKSKVAIQG